jgi:type I restriction enzyme S subunit
VQEDFFLSYEVDLPEIDHQRLLIQKIKHAKAAMAKIEVEISKQISLLANLKQAILHEAIQGKLTADWRAANRDTEPASKLLERIKEEKARLIAEKKIKKEKPLPEITPEETPFAIPEGWEWCRLGNINLEYNGGAAFKSNHILAEGRNQVVRIGNIKPDKLDLTKRPAFISEDLAQGSVTSELYPGDLLITMTGTYEKKDYCYSVLLKNGHFEDKRLFQNQRVGCFRLSQKIEKDFIKTAIKNEQLLDPVFKSSTGAANQANISKGALHNILIPLPPLKEQQAIVERVDALMETCRKLEDEIEQSSDHAADLLQAVLKEAFASAS